jgi:hypothetical protein
LNDAPLPVSALFKTTKPPQEASKEAKSKKTDGANTVSELQQVKFKLNNPDTLFH